jgi:glycosyltransferase involved in cell wall biosynthesis/SAM-dependent methyltransferase
VRIAVVGPAFPFKGGIAAHTTVLAHQLARQGHDVVLVSWLRQYPHRLYPGQQTIDVPEFELFAPTRRTLSWDRPDSWIRAGRALRRQDLVIIAHTNSIQAPAYRAMIAAMRGGQARVAVICHNVLPHESTRLDRVLISRLLRAADLVVVHSDAQARLARQLTPRPVVIADLAPHLPTEFTRGVPLPGEHRRLLFFGLVRPYKGLDVLLEALARGPSDVTLRVAGEFWGGTGDIERLCHELGIAERVELLPGYVPAADVASLFRDVDALVLPYRTATGSQAVAAGFEFGVPVIATRAGHLADDIDVGVDGLVAEPGDVDSLAAAVREFYRPGAPLRMRASVRPVDPAPYWERYIRTLLATPNRAGTEVELEGSSMAEAAPPGGTLLKTAKIAAEEALWARVAVSRQLARRRGRSRPLPSRVLPTDVLGSVAEYQRAVAECRRLGLPLHRDRPKNWDALGAVSTVLHEIGTDARVLDAGAARYSSILPWLRLYGVRELVGNNLEFTRVTRHGPVVFEPGDITSTAYADASFDAITCMSVIEHGVPLDGFARESARILRPGGLLVISTDYDQDPPDVAGKTAYGNPVMIFDPDGIRAFVKTAESRGLTLQGELRLAHAERPVHWKRTGLDYTFIRLTFRRESS